MRLRYEMRVDEKKSTDRLKVGATIRTRNGLTSVIIRRKYGDEFINKLLFKIGTWLIKKSKSDIVLVEPLEYTGNGVYYNNYNDINHESLRD